MADIKQEQQSAPITQQPAPKETPSYKVVTGSEEWSHEVFGCLDGGIAANNHLCLKTTFCPWFTYGKQQERLRNPSLQGYERINNDCLIFAGAQYCCGLSWILTFFKRGEIREKYNIKGNQLEDCLFSAFCGCCVLVQQEKEIIGRQSIAATQGYQAPPTMTA
ncbi:PLAC8 family-domain-containing protein [Bisporella sp. PMI_857]|nr:PLAC8 family-domain-containing protein [Bisporella sp. PMI_857]